MEEDRDGDRDGDLKQKKLFSKTSARTISNLDLSDDRLRMDLDETDDLEVSNLRGGLKSKLMNFVLRSAAGRHWVSARLSLRLWPLRFESMKLEREYTRTIRASMAFDGIIAQIILIGGVLVFLITAIIATALGWLPTKPVKWICAEFISQGLVLILNIIPLLALFSKEWRIHFESLFYWTSLAALTIVFWLDVEIWENQAEISPSKLLPALMWHIPLQFLSVVATSVIVNILLNTRTRVSFYYHVGILLSYLISRATDLGGTERQMPPVGAAKGIGLALVITASFCGRYFRELSDRTSVVHRIEAQTNVDRIRALVRARTSEGLNAKGRAQSPAETLLVLLSQVLDNVALCKDEEDFDRGINEGLTNVAANIAKILDVLTSHAAVSDIETTLAAAAGAESDTIEKNVIFAFANPGGAKRTKVGGHLSKDVIFKKKNSKGAKQLKEDDQGRTHQSSKDSSEPLAEEDQTRRTGPKMGEKETNLNRERTVKIENESDENEDLSGYMNMEVEEARLSQNRVLDRVYKISTPRQRFKEFSLSIDSNDVDRIGKDLSLDLSQVDFGATGRQKDTDTDNARAPFLMPPLVQIGLVLGRSSVVADLKLANCLYAFHVSHFDNPFTNSFRSAMCTHLFVATLTTVGIWRQLDGVERGAFVLASAGRSLASPGVGQLYASFANSRLALLTNDHLVIESFVCSIVFKILNLSSSDVFKDLDGERYKETRKLIISLILSGNYASHFELLSQLRLRRVSPEFNFFGDAEDRWLVSKIAFRASESCSEWLALPTHLEYVFRRTTEFFQQGDLERAARLPINPICDQSKFPMLPHWEIHYINLVCLPYFDELAHIDKSEMFRNYVTPTINAILSFWDSVKIGENKLLNIPPQISDLKIAGITNAVNRWMLIMDSEDVVQLFPENS